MNKEKTIELLKSGNFTIAYHDNGDAVIYKGHYEYDNLPKKEIYSPEDQFNGYIPEVVEMLVKALNGKVDTI